MKLSPGNHQVGTGACIQAEDFTSYYRIPRYPRKRFTNMECILRTTQSGWKDSCFAKVARTWTTALSINHVTIITVRHGNSWILLLSKSFMHSSPHNGNEERTDSDMCPSNSQQPLHLACCRVIRNVSHNNNENDGVHCALAIQRVWVVCNVMWLKYRLLHHKSDT